MSNELWAFSWEPKTFEEMVLNDKTREILTPTFETKPNLLLWGNAGTGKGTFTNILFKTIGCDYYKLNGCDSNSVDDFRTKIKTFGLAGGMSNDIKYLWLNEAERIMENRDAVRPLKDFIELVQEITRFVFIVNEFNSVPDEILSRCQVVEFLPAPMESIAKYLFGKLKEQGVKVNKNTFLEIVKKCYPDLRKTINTLQQNCVNGVMTETPQFEDDIFDEIFKQLKAGDIDAIRETLRTRAVSYGRLYTYMFDKAGETKSPGDFIIEMGEAYRWDSQVAIKEINFMTSIMKLLKKGAI